MKVHDNRHLNYSDKLHLGDMIITDEENYYQLISTTHIQYYSYLLLDITTSMVVRAFTQKEIESLSLGDKVYEDERVKEIVKNKNLVLDLRS